MPNNYYDSEDPNDPKNPNINTETEDKDEEGLLGDVKISDETVQIGDGAVINIDENLVECPDDTTSVVTVNTGSANGFLNYDETSKVFKIEQGLIDATMIGNYSITVS